MHNHSFASRALQTVVLLWVLLTINFYLPRALPGDPAERLCADPRIAAEDQAVLRAQLGLDRPLWHQYTLYLRKLAAMDLGISFSYHQPVARVVGGRLPWTLGLVSIAICLGGVVGLVVGVLAGSRRGGRLDWLVLALSVALSAIPSFWLALLLILGLAFAWPIFPAYGTVDPRLTPGLSGAYVLSLLRHAILPLSVLTLSPAVANAVVARMATIDVLSQPYLLTARAKGLSERAVLLRHVLRNVMLPWTTNLGLQFGHILGNTVVLETVFSWQGLGMLMVEACRARDYPLLQGVFLLLSVVTVLGNWAADLAGRWIDPRIDRQAG